MFNIHLLHLHLQSNVHLHHLLLLLKQKLISFLVEMQMLVLMM
jgi:hypothetical protein